MADIHKIIYRGSEVLTIEKKSKFISYIEPVNSEEEAAEFIEKIKKENWDASHNCSAVVIGNNNEFSRCSDDGEPSGTAGKPMLEVLIGEGMHNVAVVVTRYFGGVLLGTGGLVRAYQKSVKEGLKECIVLEKIKGKKIKLQTDYNSVGKIQYIASTMEVNTIASEYGENVFFEFILPEEDSSNFVDKIIEVTKGQGEIEIEENVEYGIKEGECILF